MQFYKKFLCFLLAAALLLVTPGTAMALEGEEVSGAEGLVQALDGAAGEGEIAEEAEEPDESGDEPDEPGDEPDEEPVRTLPMINAVLAPAEDVSEYPVLLLRGGWHPMYYMEGTEEQVKVFDTDDLLSVNNFLPLLKDLVLACLIPLNWRGLSNIMVKFLWDAFGPTQVQLDGSYDETVSCNNLELRELDDHNQMHYTVDWRRDPVDTAYDVRAFIEGFFEEHPEYDKINICSISGSGQALLTYLKLFGTDVLASVFFNMSMHNGSSLFGGLATKQFGLDPTALGYLMPVKDEAGYDASDPIAIVLRIAYELGLLSVLQKTFNFAVKHCVDRVYDEAMIPMIFTMPQMWSYVPTAQYEQAKAMLFKGDPKYDALVAKTDYYRYEILAHQDEILLKTASEVKTAVAAGYGLPVAGVVKGTDVQGDLFVDTKYASFGATCPSIDRPFPASYKQARLTDWDFMSPDRLVDASTCTLPETTWFFKYRTHRAEDSYKGWYEWFLQEAGDYTVFGNTEEFPQFQYYADSKANRKLDPGWEGGHNYLPVSGALPVRSTFYAPLLSVLLFLAKAWRFVLVLPIFWM